MSRPQTAHRQSAGRRPADAYPGPRYDTDRDSPSRYPGPGGPPPSSRRRMMIATVVAAVVAGAVIGLGGAEWYTSRDEAKPAAAAPERSIEEIASTIGCKPQQIGKNSEFRQSACVTGNTRLTILSFVSNQKMFDWIKEAEGYGGAYLVGTKWLVTTNSAETLDPLVSKLGGRVMLDSHYTENKPGS